VSAHDPTSPPVVSGRVKTVFSLGNSAGASLMSASLRRCPEPERHPEGAAVHIFPEKPAGVGRSFPSPLVTLRPPSNIYSTPPVPPRRSQGSKPTAKHPGEIQGRERENLGAAGTPIAPSSPGEHLLSESPASRSSSFGAVKKEKDGTPGGSQTRQRRPRPGISPPCEANRRSF